MFELRIGKLNIKITFHSSDILATGLADGFRIQQAAILAKQIQEVYTLSELRQASYFIGVEFENLSGDTRFDKAYGLVTHMQRRDAIPCLKEYLLIDRPNIQWGF